MDIDVGEAALLARIQTFGADVYAGSFTTLRGRIGHTIVVHRIATVVAGRGLDGKSETFGQAFKRIYGETLPTRQYTTPHTVSDRRSNTP